MNAQTGQGGQYIIDGDGHRVRVESTEDHPDGNGPRPDIETGKADKPAPAKPVKPSDSKKRS